MSSLLDGLGGKAAPEEDGPITSKSAITPPKAEKTGAAATAAAAADDEEEPTPKPKTAVGKEAVGDEDKPGVKPKVPIEEETAGPLKPPKAAATATETETGKVKGSEADPAAATSTDITAKQAYDRCVNAVDKSKCGDALAAWVYVIIAVAIVIVGLAAWNGARRYKRKHKRDTAPAVLPAYSPYPPVKLGG